MGEYTFNCPICEIEMKAPVGEAFADCPACQARLDVQALLAYLRGLEAFDDGQDTTMKQRPHRFQLFGPPQDRKAMDLFREAYTSLQLAFEGELVESQRQLGIEMMASMSQEFFKQSMVSDFEGQYWFGVMAELTSQKEYDSIKEKLLRTPANSLYLIKVWNWRRRQAELLKVLAGLERRLAFLESQIDFVNLPRARSRNWKP